MIVLAVVYGQRNTKQLAFSKYSKKNGQNIWTVYPDDTRFFFYVAFNIESDKRFLLCEMKEVNKLKSIFIEHHVVTTNCHFSLQLIIE